MSKPRKMSTKRIHAYSLDAGNATIWGNLHLKNVAVVTPSTGNNVRIGSSATGVIVAPTGTLAALTLTFPTGVDGRVLHLSFTQDITTLSTAGATFANASAPGPAITAGATYTLIYNGASGKWFKLA